MLNTSEIIVNNKTHKYYFLENKKNKNVIIFLNGSNGRPNNIEVYSHKVFKENYFITFDNICHGDNPLKPSSRPYAFIKFVRDIINELKEEEKFKDKKFIIIGESLGAALTLMIATRWNNLADLFFCWNAPTKLGKPEIKDREAYWNAVKKIFTLITNIET
ncbi:MAG: hypothetical protein ACRC4M_00820, partial [Mycoplasma sp.]